MLVFGMLHQRDGIWYHLVCVCPIVWLSQKRNYIETTGRIELVLGIEASFLVPAILHCVVRILRYLRKIRVLSSVSLTQTIDL